MVKSVLSPNVTIRNNSLNGKGMFAKNDIKMGEVVFIKGGHVLRREELDTSGVINSYFPLSDEYFLAATNEAEEDAIKLYINHSCNSNCGLRGLLLCAIFQRMRN